MPTSRLSLIPVTRLFTIANNYGAEFQAEEWALYQTLSQSFNQLKTLIMYCEAKKDENVQRFSKVTTVANEYRIWENWYERRGITYLWVEIRMW